MSKALSTDDILRITPHYIYNDWINSSTTDATYTATEDCFAIVVQLCGGTGNNSMTWDNNISTGHLLFADRYYDNVGLYQFVHLKPGDKVGVSTHSNGRTFAFFFVFKLPN